MTDKARRILLLVLLGASALPLIPGSRPEMPFGQGASPVVLERRRDGAPREGTARGPDRAPSAPMLLEIKPRTVSAPAGDAFRVPDRGPQREMEPAMPVARPVEARRPAAPPLPFVYLGKKIEDGNWLVFVGRNGRVYILKEGDILEDAYRVEAIRPPAMTLNYLPLKQNQTLAIGDTP